MTDPFLSRRALARVLTSLLKNELKAASHYAQTLRPPEINEDEWPEDLLLTGPQASGLRCDSLDLLRLAAATNEMFHLYEAEPVRDLLSANSFSDWLDSIEAAWASGVARVTFMTSGSTGKAKRCTHEFSHLQAEIAYLAEVFADRLRIVPLTPAHHIYGFLFTAMLPDALARNQAKPNICTGQSLPQELRSGDLIVSFPERWEWLHRTVARFPDGVAGVVSTAPCSEALKNDLVQQGLKSLTEVYGSSETAGLGVRCWPESRYHFMPHWKVSDAGDVEGVMLTHDSGLQAQVKDHLVLQDDGSFTLGGRIDEAVQVGGVNVHPTRVAGLLRKQPGVENAVVRLTGTEGARRLKAFVVPMSHIDVAELHRRLEDWASTALVSAERPRSIMFGEALPKDKMGKDCDW